VVVSPDFREKAIIFGTRAVIALNLLAGISILLLFLNGGSEMV
jgi:hypothetical protein